MKKRLLSALLALTVLLGSMPVYALEDTTPATPDPATISTTETAANAAAGAGESSAAESQAENTETQMTEEITVDTSEADLPDNDELFALYMQGQMYPGGIPSLMANWGQEENVLNENELALYNEIKDFVQRVARGEVSSTEEVQLPFEHTWTGEELGITSWDEDTIKEAVAKKLNINLSRVVDCLLVDCPADLYWFDKTTGISAGYSMSAKDNTVSIGVYVISMPVAKDYQVDGGDAYSVDTAKTGATKTVLANAQGIVSQNESKSDYEKLLAYKNEICRLTSYNDDAAKESNKTPYGDPWQLIYVFDDNPDTTVVCEGYAKAFQYLCDLSEIDCYTVTGTMNGGEGEGAHMWNIVPMDGRNYLVDVTNCDEGTAGSPDKLFLVGTAGSVDGGYTFTIDNDPPYADAEITYTYGSESKDLYGTNVLTLADSNYDPSQQVEELTISGLPTVITYGDHFALTTEGASGAVTWSTTGPVSVNDGNVTVTGVGDFTITATAGGQEDTVSGEAVPKALTVTGATAQGKTYDGSANVGVDAVTLAGIVSGDAVSVDLSKVTGMVSSANAGIYETISLQNLSLTGDKVDCYTLAATADNVPTMVTIQRATPAKPEGPFPATYGQKLSEIDLPDGWNWTEPETALNQVGDHIYQAQYTETTNYTGDTVTLTVRVTAKTVGPTVTVADNLTFTGSAIQPEVTVQVDGVTLTKDTDYTVSYSNNINAGTATITVQAIAGSGYAFADVVKTFTIEKAAVPAATTQNVTYRYTVTGEQQATVQNPMPSNAGTVTYSKGNTADAKGIVSEWSVQGNGTVVYTLSGKGAAGDTATLPVIVSSQNYEDTTFDLVITLIDRDVPVVTAQPYTKPYDGNPVDINDITKDSGNIEGTWSWKDGTAAPVNVADSKTYQLVFTPKDTTNYAPVEVGVLVTITQAPSSVANKPAAMPGLTYTGQPQALVTEGTAEGGTLQYALSEDGPYSEELPTATDAGDYTVWYKVAGDGNHTDIAAAQLGTVTIAKAVPQAPQNLTTTYSHGAILSSVNLPDGWEWVNPNELLGDWGQKEFMAKHPGDGNYVPNEVAVEVYIKFADCSLGDVRVDDSMLTYNGAWQRLTGIQLSLEGYVLQQGIDYTVEDSGGIEAGSYVATLQGKGNYRGMIKYQYYILPKPVMAQVVAEDKVYDGTTDAVVSAEVETGVAGEKLTITGLKGTFAQADAGENLTVTVDSSQASWGNNNYEVTFPETATGSILPADYTYSGVADQTVKIGNSLDTVNLVTTAAGVADETVQGAVTWYRDKACTQPLPEDYLFSGQEGGVVTLYWKFTPDAAYTNYTSVPQTGSTDFTLTPKATPQVSAQGLTKTYDGKAVTLEDLNPTADVPGSWALDVSTPELKNAGDYKVLLRFTPDNSRDYVTTSILVPVKVEPRLFTLGLELSSNQITTGEELPTARLVWSGALEGEDMTPEGEAAFTGWPESGKAGYYAIQWANCQEMLQALMDKPAAVNYRFQIREDALLTVTQATLLPGSDETYRLEAQEGLPEVPEAVQQAGFPTEEAVLDEMFQYAARQLTGATQENTVLHDVRLYYSPDGGKTWEKATEENFPAEGITVTLPYPDGTNAADFDFLVTHMLTVGEKAGQVETPAVTKADKGIQFTVHSLSPIAISWKVAPKNIMSEEQTITREPISANSSGSISYYTCPACGYHDWTATDEGYRCDECGYLESMKQLSGYGNVKGTYEPKSSGATTAAAETIPQTGDESKPVLWAVLMFASALTLGGLMVSRRKHNR